MSSFAEYTAYMEKNTDKLVCVTLREEHFNGKRNFYFGSLRAIYTHLPEELIGIKYKSLTNAIRATGHYINKKVSIHIDELYHQPKSTKHDAKRKMLVYESFIGRLTY